MRGTLWPRTGHWEFLASPDVGLRTTLARRASCHGWDEGAYQAIRAYQAVHKFKVLIVLSCGSAASILLIALGFGAFPTVLRHCLRSLPKPPLREAFDMSRSHQFPSVPAYFSARCRSRSSASAKPVVVVGPHLFTRSSRNRSQSIDLFT